MITLGIDLASDPKNTAICRIAWGRGRAVVEQMAVDQEDADLLHAMRDTDKVGIDAPFGWPVDFVKAISAHDSRGAWPAEMVGKKGRETLRLRATDRWVTEEDRRLHPLSVSADRIAIPAMRCAALISEYAREHGAVDRAGSGRLCEVYPAGALRVWGHRATGCKRRAGADALAELVAALLASAPWLDVSQFTVGLACDHNFDALVSALVARAAAMGLTRSPPERLGGKARREGWIHLPEDGSFVGLMTR